MHQRRSMPVQVAAPPPASLNGNSKRGSSQVSPAPTWDADTRKLSLDGVVIKHFRCPAPLQEAILAAFEELGWPARIDDPLPPLPGRNQKKRLRVTIGKLNSGLSCPLVRFKSDGRGQGICHEIIGGAWEAHRRRSNR